MKNPFNIMYGMIPASLVNRNDAFDKIMSSFQNDDTIAASFIITGIRGSGKTVLLRGISKELSKKEDWIVIDLNPQGDLVSSLAEKLYDEIKRSKLPFDLSLDLTLPNVTFHISKKKESLSAENAIPHLLDALRSKNKRMLITIDEVNQTRSFRFFANLYQNLIGNDYPVFLLMTGLYENVDSLISDKAASFLARCPKVTLNPLNLISVSKMYQKELGAAQEEANNLAKLSKGYAFAYQVIGKICFEKQKTAIDENLLNDMDSYLSENGYSVIWKGMTEGEKKICLAIAKAETDSTAEIVKKSGLKIGNFNNFRARMIYKGYLVSNAYGKLAFSLPRFKEYVLSIEPFII